jgi:hypothetical protein
MRYRLRTLLVVLALGPVVLAGAWWGWTSLGDSDWDRGNIDSLGPFGPFMILGLLGAVFVAAMVALVVLLKSREA